MGEELKNLREGSGGIELPDDLQVPVASAPKPASPMPVTAPPIVEPDLSYAPPSLPPLRPAQRKVHLGWWLWGVLIISLVGVTVYVGLKYINFNQGKITFTFAPAGVVVTIDQKLIKTDANVNAVTVALKVGDHQVQVTKEGYLDFEQAFTLIAGETSQMSVVLSPIPSAELLAETATAFPALASKDQLLVFWDAAAAQFKAIDLTAKTIINVVEGTWVGLQRASWSKSGVAVMVKLSNVWKLKNMKDNRNVVGQYIPLGDTPRQAPTFNNGVATWLLDNERRTENGVQPVLLNENIRDVVFSSDGTRIVYFYAAANGERSLIAADTDGGNWTRLVTDIDGQNPTLQWLEDDRHVLLLDDNGKPDRIVDTLSQATIVAMPDRLANTAVVGSPEGDKILYLTNQLNGAQLAVWDVASNQAVQMFDKPVSSFVWKDNNTVIAATTDGSLWYWVPGGQTKPVKFVSAFGNLQPKQLLYSRRSQTLFILETTRVFSVIA